MPQDFNQQIIDEFRANQGQVAMFDGARLLLLTTTGARTGASHTTPVGYLPDGGGRMLIIASAGGSPRHPAWYHNLLAEPKVKVEDGVFTYQAEAVVLEGEERDSAFARAVEMDPGWAAYQEKTSRVIPVVALTPLGGGPNAGRGGDMLVAVHDAFRRELRLIRKEVAASGTGGLGVQLRINCLTLCQGLHHHHTIEDARMFPGVEGQYPELGPVMDRLREEHGTVARLLGELQRLLADSEPEVAAERVLTEVDRLTTELEAHLDYEEEYLVPILNAL
ncbi:nitroreductase/quinone reductase family protein [Nonomuraea guangzhouensis]|uniref:Nitroreductase/quinone reductase family protein n=1 Tax=Nonomuraea guangzhouensis TaxID=1291555 RepID=A0ABW4GGV7_9ACTN|nr:nitroreductase/quinone reductase family protein [Nonomuraea guangzhouensis]